MSAPLTLPPVDGDWASFVDSYAAEKLTAGHAAAGRIHDGTTGDALSDWNEAALNFADALFLLSTMSETHPDPDVRRTASARHLETENAAADLHRDAASFSAVSAIDPATLDSDAARARELILEALRASGAHLADDERERLAAVDREVTELSQAFDENIRESKGSITVRPQDLVGLPEDFIAERTGDDGSVTLTTDYPDLIPVMDMCASHEVRAALLSAAYERAFPENDDVLRRLLDARDRKARLLGAADFTDVSTALQMIGSGEAIEEFIGSVNRSARPAAERDLARLLERARRDDAASDSITYADSSYYIERLRDEDLGVDPSEVRSYLHFDKVRDGILELAQHLFGYEFACVADAPRWHEDVEAYDVTADGDYVGRFYLDMYPREGKFSHMACFGLGAGYAGRSVPEPVLVCNFSRGYMTFDDLVTFLHEFGHLIHTLAEGHHAWAPFSRMAGTFEWDFIEAPSQMLEEWAWNADILQRFATNDAGEPIPAALVERLRAGRDLCEGLLTARQLSLATQAYRLHRDHPEDVAGAVEKIEREFDVRERLAGTHAYASFGHLSGYQANYYTYQWSLSIAKDLFTAFDPEDMRAADVVRRYRDEVLSPGLSRPAAASIEAFLGRPGSTDAYQEWLDSL